MFLPSSWMRPNGHCLCDLAPLPRVPSPHSSLSLSLSCASVSVHQRRPGHLSKHREKRRINHYAIINRPGLPVFTAIDEPNHIYPFDRLASTQSTGGSHASVLLLLLLLTNLFPHRLQPKVSNGTSVLLLRFSSRDSHIDTMDARTDEQLIV
jgi:hypothetical protein